MCGIVAIVSAGEGIDAMLARADAMQKHRGPDDSGRLAVRAGRYGVGLGHQRLSILDLSQAAHQPMSSGDGKSWIVFNGEIYNYLELRQELAKSGAQFRSDGDTEVLLAALERYGVENALSRLNGMFAFAWLDARRGRLVLARDRFGVKPLYYAVSAGQLILASEIKTVLAAAKRRFRPNRQVIGEFLFESLLDTGEETFFEGIRKVPAGHWGEIDLNADLGAPQWKRYWQLDIDRPLPSAAADRIELIESLFVDAVRIRLRSDVPVGAMLSGGIDSSAIASVMQELLGGDSDLNLFSAVSDDPRFDESVHIDRMARYLGRGVHKIALDFKPQRVRELLDRVVFQNDEPFTSLSIVAHYLIMQRASERGIKVILSGQGADEIFCGYLKYLGFNVQELVHRGQPVKALRLLAAFWRRGTVLKQFTLRDAKRYLPKRWKPNEVGIAGETLRDYVPVIRGLSHRRTLKERQREDVDLYSVPVLTHYDDRMSMAFGRELRNPFLDWRLVQAATSLAAEDKLNSGWTKYLFRKAMEKRLPKEIAWRKDKMGFSNPESEWLRGPLQSMVMEAFAEGAQIFRNGLVDRPALLDRYRRFIRQSPDGGWISVKDIFNPLVTEIWLQQYAAFLE